MPALPRALIDEAIDTLRGDGHADLAERLSQAVARPRDLTSTQAAELLGVTSPNTIKNWLKGGYFPGAYQTPGGHWRFPRDAVLAARAEMDDARHKNATRDLSPPTFDDDDADPYL